MQKNLYPKYLSILLVQVKIFHLLFKVKFIRTLFYLAREIKAKKEISNQRPTYLTKTGRRKGIKCECCNFWQWGTKFCWRAWAVSAFSYQTKRGFWNVEKFIGKRILRPLTSSLDLKRKRQTLVNNFIKSYSLCKNYSWKCLNLISTK